jgi:hypothetical protein
MKNYLHGESVLPLLAIALFALLFIAGPLADAGALPRPFIGMLLLIVTLAGLLALRDVHRLVVPVLVLFVGVVFAIEVATLLRPSEPLVFAKDMVGVVLVTLLAVSCCTWSCSPGA